MRHAIEFLQANDAYFLLGLSALSLILLICTACLFRKLGGFRRRYNTKLADGNVGEIVDCLAQQTSAIAGLEARLDQLSEKQAKQQQEMAGCVQKVGIVRFDAFDDVGGEQSFSLALLDGDDSGVVFSSLYGRQDTRVYAKAIARGEGERALSGEEQDALTRALAGNSR